MDYGRTNMGQMTRTPGRIMPRYRRPPVNTRDDALFNSGITTGVGKAPDAINPGANESLHSDDQSIAWNGRNSEAMRGVGNTAMNLSAETQGIELGEVRPAEGVEETPVVMPPGYELPKEDTVSAVESTAEEGLDTELRHENPRRETLSPETYKVVKHIEKNIDHPDIFYDQARNLADKYASLRGFVKGEAA